MEPDIPPSYSYFQVPGTVKDIENCGHKYYVDDNYKAFCHGDRDKFEMESNATISTLEECIITLSS